LFMNALFISRLNVDAAQYVTACYLRISIENLSSWGTGVWSDLNLGFID